MSTEVKTRRKTQDERREESERKLYDALIEIIINDGISAATCENIGKLAGYSRGLITTRLGRRDQMFSNLIERLKNAQLDKLDAAINGNMSRTDAIKAYIKIHFDDLKDDPGYNAYFVLVAGSLTTTPLLRDEVTQTHELIRDVLSQFIQDGIKTGEFSRDIDPNVSAVTIGSYLLGTAIQNRLRTMAPIDDLRAGAIALIPPSQL